jgi:RNA polymerase sigma-70 factor (ECF subfamily)|tara:strand:+ start:369 stop:905 length:537 start_codon:yes stop_codon:yes gene_type:complete
MNELKNLFISMRSILAAAVANIVPAHEIEDVVQETYVKLCLIKSDKAILHPRSYLYQIAKNIAKDRVKSASFKLVDSIDDHEDILSVDEEDEVYLAAVSHEEFSQFCEAVRFLPLQCRRVFVLRKVYGFSQREVAKQLEIAESTVEKHVALGLRRCSERMTKSAVDDNNGHIKVGSDG